MMLAVFLLLFLLKAVDGESSETVCSYQDVLKYLNLSKNNELYSMTRPVKSYKNPTHVSLEVLLYAILDVREIDQTFVPYVWIFTSWQNEHIYWDTNDFCGIETVSLPIDVLWKPDLMIEEMTEKDKSPQSPHLTLYHTGLVRAQDDQVLVSTCRMHVYKFPFDIQSCNLSFKSVVHSVKEIQLVRHHNSSHVTELVGEMMRTQYEWLFINMTVTNKTVNMFEFQQDVMIYTITMKRRPLLYIVNFLVPILFFFCLDLASFLISDSGGEKLSFKVTVLLAITVMQLILNEILPSSSERSPLIVVYCIGIFSLMLLSLLETILVMHLMEKDSASQDSECREEKKWIACICDSSADETSTELLKGSSSRLTKESHASDELKEVVKMLAVLLNSRKEKGKPGYWTRKYILEDIWLGIVALPDGD
ncbi:5-hydroxytryptamine receptor 3A-like [Cottoperca gobio]|uniref:5-hydroxytryptamine receptor 3A-like n=1 Tax=Cottoperca gobio TaxID=56716 RepID=A0A6J2RSZ6_COTGO|nr:5-hydroxytryptamine receptor 3A-like [Cottoperca gobio]